MSVVNAIIRNAVASDVKSIISLAEQSETAAHWTEREYARLFDVDAPLRTVLVLTIEGEITGFMVASCLGSDWEIENIVVASEKRGSGLADRLMAELLERAQKSGAESIFLEVRESNEAARALYRKWDFAEIAKRKEYYSAPVEDGVVCRKRL